MCLCVCVCIWALVCGLSGTVSEVIPYDCLPRPQPQAGNIAPVRLPPLPPRQTNTSPHRRALWNSRAESQRPPFLPERVSPAPMRASASEPCNGAHTPAIPTMRPVIFSPFGVKLPAKAGFSAAGTEHCRQRQQQQQLSAAWLLVFVGQTIAAA